MKHLDLFSGIGGFALAVDQVYKADHVFCDNDKFCQKVIKKHWPNSKIYEDIREITEESADLITGGFPCQPFSQAGKRKGTQDNRYLWPEMFRVIRLAKPTYVIAENVRGLLNIEGGLVFEQVCLDLESEGYSVQPFVIPAISVNAPHRRDRVWFVANRQYNGRPTTKETGKDSRTQSESQTREKLLINEFKGIDSLWTEVFRRDTTNPLGSISRRKDSKNLTNEGREKSSIKSESLQSQNQQARSDNFKQSNTDGWSRNWYEVATELCRVDDGVSEELDRSKRLKALGNAIVPKVAIEIMRSLTN